MQKFLILLLTAFLIIGCTKKVELDVLPNDTYDRLITVIPMEPAGFDSGYNIYISKKLPQNVMGINTRNLQIEEVRYDFNKENKLCAFYMTIIGRDSTDKLIARIDDDNRFLRLRDDYGMWAANTEELAHGFSQVHVLYDFNDTNKAVMSIEVLRQCFRKD